MKKPVMIRGEYFRIVLMCIYITTEHRVWSVSLIIASFGISDETGMSITTFTHLKTLPIPEDIGSLFTRFDVLQIDGDHIVISGNWSSKAFLLIDWKQELMAIYRCSVRLPSQFSVTTSNINYRHIGGPLIGE
jgi:hypothetical protein